MVELSQIDRDPLGRHCTYNPPLSFNLTIPLEVGAAQAILLDLPAPPNGDKTDQAFFYLLSEDHLVGYFNRCTHLPVPLDFDDGQMLDREGLIICRMHGARFAPEDGSVLIGPASCKLVRIHCKLIGDQTIEISGWSRE